MTAENGSLPEAGKVTAEEVGEFSLGALLRPLRVFWEPARVFQEIAKKPTFFWVLLLHAAMVLGVQLVVTPRLDMEATILTAMQRRGQEISQEQLAEAVQGAQRFAKVRIVLAPLASLAVLAMLSGLYFLAAKVVGSEVDYGHTFSAVAHASFPPGLTAAAVFALVASARVSFSAQEIPRLVKSNLAALFPDALPAFLRGVFGVLDVFNVWYWVLLVMGLSAVAGIRRLQAIGIVAFFWGLWALLQGIVAVLWG